MIYGLPKDKPVQEQNDKLREYVYDHFTEDKIMMTYIIGDYTTSYSIYLIIQQLKLKLRHYTNYLLEYGTRPTKRKHFWNVVKIDLINFTQQQLDQREQEYKLSLHLTDKSSGYGFIVCRSMSDKHVVLSHFKRVKNEYSRWIVLKSAPSPSEIQWENLNVPIQFKIAFRVLVYVVFILVFLVFMTPASFLKYFNTVLGGDDLTGFRRDLVRNYLPPLLLLLYQSVILPEFIKILVANEKHISKSKQTLSAMHKYLIFNLVYVFLVPAVGYSVLDLLIGAFSEGFQTWQVRLTESIAHTGYFFSSFIIHQTFLKSGLDLLTPLRLIQIKLTQISAVTDEEKLLAYSAPTYSWDYQFAIAVTNLTIVLSMCIIYPVILGLGVMYFFIRYGIHKYLVMCVYYVDPKQSGVRLLRSILRYFHLCILIFQIVTASQLILHDSGEIKAVGSVVFFISIAIFLFFNRQTSRLLHYFRRKLLRRSLSSDNLPTVTRDPKEYIHPIQILQENEKLTV